MRIIQSINMYVYVQSKLQIFKTILFLDTSIKRQNGNVQISTLRALVNGNSVDQ